MVKIFEISINFLEEFIVTWFLTKYFGSKCVGWKKEVGFLIGWITASVLVTWLNSLYIYEGFLGLIFTLIFFLYALFFLKGNAYIKLFVAGFINCVIYFIALITILCAGIIFDVGNDEIFSMTSERIVVIAVTKSLLFLFCLVMLRFRFNDVGKKRNLIALIIMPVVSQISMIGIMNVFLNFNAVNMDLLLACSGVMIANILIYYFFIKINSDVRREVEYNILQQKYESDKRHAKDIEELYSETCSLRHDLISHFTAISGLLSEGETKVKEYIEAVTDNHFKIMKSFIKTGNECFDAIVNTKVGMCEREGISTEIRVMNKSLDKLKNEEIGILFGNLFDNAIEAAKNSEKKKIELYVQTQNAYLSIYMSNTIDKSVLEENRELVTSKKDKKQHGFGTKNVKKIVDNYNGFINYFEENGYFCCDILI